MTSRSRRGFTFLELLVVMAIASVMVGSVVLFLSGRATMVETRALRLSLERQSRLLHSSLERDCRAARALSLSADGRSLRLSLYPEPSPDGAAGPPLGVNYSLDPEDPTRLLRFESREGGAPAGRRVTTAAVDVDDLRFERLAGVEGILRARLRWKHRLHDQWAEIESERLYRIGGPR